MSGFAKLLNVIFSLSSLANRGTESAVNNKLRAGDVLCLVRCQKYRRLCDIPCVSHMAEWHLGITLPAHSLLGVTGIRPCKDRKSTRLNSSHVAISYAVFCLKKKTPHA